MSDAEARHALRTELDHSFFVEASAGTGKTHEIVTRAVAVIASGWAPMEALAIVTFTEKAAGELRLRLRQSLDAERARWPADAPVNQRLATALARLEDATIDTVHGFCREILRTRPMAAGIDPDFVVESDRDLWLGRVFDAWFAERVQAPTPGLARYLARGRVRTPDRTPSSQLLTAVKSILDRRELSAPWPRADVDLEQLARDALQEARALAHRVAEGELDDPLHLACAPLLDVVAWFEDGTVEPEELEARLVELSRPLRDVFIKTSGPPLGTGPYTATQSRSDLKRLGQACARRLADFARLADSDLAAALREELREVEARYHERLRKGGRLDFDDLLVRTRNLLRDQPSARRDLQERFRCVMVDEFQDTDPLQAEIVLLLAAEDPEANSAYEAKPAPGKLVLVGDPKQSIYGFRGADLDVYRTVRKTLIEHGVRLLQLGTSHRAVAPIQTFVNTAFEPALSEDVGYVPLEGGPPSTDQPSIVALPVKRPLGQFGKAFGKAVDESMPETVGGFVAWLLRESGWTVRDGDARRALRPSDVCLLFRRMRSWGRLITAPFELALEAHGIDAVLVGARALHGRDEVEALCTVLHALEWPDDELMVYGALKGPFFGFTDETLWAHRRRHGRINPFRAPHGDDNLELRSALELLKTLSRKRNQRPFADTVQAFLRGTRAHVMLGLRPGSQRILGNVERVLDLARRYEVAEGFSFRGFVRRLRAEADEARTSEGVVSEESTVGVRMMTVHKAKGLEFPVVIVADPEARLDRTLSSTVDSSAGLAAMKIGDLVPQPVAASETGLAEVHRETTRLAYVACTRARDLLVVPTVGVPPNGWAQRAWLTPVLQALRPPLHNEPELSPDWPAFGRHSLEVDPGHKAPPSIRPGRHRAPGGDVVWWDPNVLPVPSPPRFGLAHETFLASSDTSPSTVERYERWKEELRMRREDGRVASVPAVDTRSPPTEGLGAFAISERPLAGAEGRPSGPRYGQLVHAVLRDAEWSRLEESAPALARLHGRRLAAPASEVEATIEVVRLLAADELILRALEAPQRHLRFPVVVSRPDGVLDVVFDLLFETSEGWMAVDFVTGKGLDDALRARMVHGLGALRDQGWLVRAGVVLRV